jgi:multidrug efflux pump subunit AcrA (membrane-fusion protein)
MRKFTLTHHVVLSTISAVLAMSAGTVGCAAPSVAASADATEPIAVTIAQVAMTDIASPFEVGGVVQALSTAALTARILAPVREVRVRPGDQVRAGETLIVLDSADLVASSRAAGAAALAADHASTAAAAELQGAEAGLALARASHDRVVVLQAKRSATPQEFDDATATLRSAEARVASATARAMQAALAVESARAASEQARATQSFTTITAPFDGMVTEKMVDPGNMASPGVPLLRLEDTRGFRLEVRVDQSRTDQIHKGDSVPVFLGAATSAIEGSVVEISRAVDADARAFLVKIALPDAPGLRSGEFAKARFGGATRRALTVPRSAIVRRGQLTFVFVVDRGIAALRFVNVNDAEVLAGLVESELVVVSPPAALTDGRRISAGGQ